MPFIRLGPLLAENRQLKSIALLAIFLAEEYFSKIINQKYHNKHNQSSFYNSDVWTARNEIKNHNKNARNY
jgi:hypothetical protein